MPSSSTLLRGFQRRLLKWYAANQRKLPWRETRDPYKILVSEIMLQQTQVDRVLPKYQEFLKRYPTIESLAKAPTRQLRRVWYPLGYNIRPMRLRDIARQAIRRHGGRIPDTYDRLIAMDGIGRYTAGAILSFAYEQDAPILDTNVARLLSRYFGVRGGSGRASAIKASADGRRRLSGARTQRRLWQLAEAVIPKGKGYDINQAMMDFGAVVCTARAPKCPACALRSQCRSYPYEAPAEHRPRRHRRH